MPTPSPSFESQAHELLGRLVMVYSSLDVNLALYIHSRDEGHTPRASLARLAETHFKGKLDLLDEVVRRVHAQQAAALQEWAAWIASADKLRGTRNDFMHGRWGFIHHRQSVANVTGLPGAEGQTQRVYSLPQLAEEVASAQRVSAAFRRLTDYRRGS